MVDEGLGQQAHETGEADEPDPRRLQRRRHRALEAGVRLHGCTVHFVRAAMDDGPIIVQAAVPVLPGDDEAALARRVLAAEHRCYPLALKLVAEKRVTVANERVAIDAPAQEAVLINPPPILG